jgi:acyl dehydratase
VTRFDGFEQVAEAVGRDLGVSGWHTITAEHVAMFADATDAHEWIHLDTERARQESPFGTPVAHGYLTLSLATPFLTQLLDLGPSVLGVNYGLERVRFPAAVPVGSRVRARGVLKAAEPFGSGLRTTVELSYESDGAGKSPCVAEVVSLLQPPSRR